MSNFVEALELSFASSLIKQSLGSPFSYTRSVWNVFFYIFIFKEPKELWMNDFINAPKGFIHNNIQK